jgi:hypothetical protein
VLQHADELERTVRIRQRDDSAPYVDSVGHRSTER